MAKEINVSLEEMESTIASIGSFINDLNSETSSFESQVRGLSGKDWNEETGANINNNLELATDNIKKLIEKLGVFQSVLTQLKEGYEAELASYRNQKI